MSKGTINSGRYHSQCSAQQESYVPVLWVHNWDWHEATSIPIFPHWPAGSSHLQAGSFCQWAETSGWCEENCEASKSTRAQCNQPEPKTSLPGEEKVRLQPDEPLGLVRRRRSQWSLTSNKGRGKTMLSCGSIHSSAHEQKLADLQEVLRSQQRSCTVRHDCFI